MTKLAGWHGPGHPVHSTCHLGPAGCPSSKQQPRIWNLAQNEKQTQVIVYIDSADECPFVLVHCRCLFCALVCTVSEMKTPHMLAPLAAPLLAVQSVPREGASSNFAMIPVLQMNALLIHSTHKQSQGCTLT